MNPDLSQSPDFEMGEILKLEDQKVNKRHKRSLERN